MANDIYTKNLSKHYLYQTWAAIKRRCFKPNDRSFKNYGAIGITMYPEWIESSRTFLKWMDENLRIET
jgi:hypothetical protein